MANRVPHTEYLGHGGRDEYSELWHPSEKQQEVWHYTLYEIKLDGEVDLDTGKFYIQSLDGVELKEEVSA